MTVPAVAQDPERPVSNPLVARALADFAAGDGGERPVLDVARQCLQGFLLRDVTGSSMTFADGRVEAGSTIQLRGGGFDDGPAVVAFTSQEEAGRSHGGGGPELQTLVQRSVDVLAEAAGHDDGWLLLDPEGLGVRLSSRLVAQALDGPRNEAVKEAVAALHSACPVTCCWPRSPRTHRCCRP